MVIFVVMGVQFVDFKIEFGLMIIGKVLLVDEILLDSCWLVDLKIGVLFDKDVFCKDLGDLISVYQEVLMWLVIVEEV